MKRRLPVFFISISFIVSVLYISCGNKNTESDLKSDSVKPDEPVTLKKDDSADIVNDEKPTLEKTKTDSTKPVKNQKDTINNKTEKKNIVKVVAYYFHATARCSSCINIENFTEEVIKTTFAKENKEGLVSFRQLNIEDSVNEHYIEDYKLEFSSVILAKYVNGKQVKWKNLEHVWKYSGEKENFFKYMKIEIKDFLKEKEGSS